MSQIIHLIDRSRVETRENCPRKRYLNYDYTDSNSGGVWTPGDVEVALGHTGLEPEEQALPLLSGIAIHAAHARLLAGEKLEVVIADILGGYKAEIAERGLLNIDVTKAVIAQQAALLEGMLRLWAHERMPRILEEYEVVSIEEAWRWELYPGLVQTIRMDVILRHRATGVLFILDYKSVKFPSDIWFDKFEHSKQTCLYLQALKERTQEEVGGILYEGLVKGAFRQDTARNSPWYGQKIQQSPYTIAYKLGSEVGSIYQTDYTNKKGYQKVQTFEEMSMKDWVEHWMLSGADGMENPSNLFIAVPQIMPPAAELLQEKQQTIDEELKYLDQLGTYREIHQGTASDERYLNLFAPFRKSHCYQYGQEHKCQFLSVCFNQGAQPLLDGGFRVRRPHHDTDLKMVA